MKKTILLLYIILAVSLTGCGNKVTEQATTETPTTTEVTTEEVTTEAAEEKAIKNLKEFIDYAEKFNNSFKDAYDLEIKVWNNCTDQKKSDDTDPYTMDSNGKFYDNSYDALNRLWNSQDFIGMHSIYENYLSGEKTAYNATMKCKDADLISSLEDKITEIYTLSNSQMSYEGETFNIIEYSVNINDNYNTIKENIEFIKNKLN